MISVMIPTFNDEDTLEMCLASFAGFADEICIVDDCSDDGTVEIIQRFAEIAPLVWERNDRRKGWIKNRQRLLGMATHDILLCTDSDCILREDCIDDLLQIAESLTPKCGCFLPLVCLIGDVFHTHNSVIHGPDPNHSIWRRGGKERWFTNPTYSEEYLEDVALRKYPGQPPLFHLGVRSDLRMVQRRYARQWMATTGGNEPYMPWLLAYVGISEEELDEWAKRRAFEILKGRGVQRYDPEQWYPYPATMEGELTNPRYRFVYGDGQLVAREKLR